MPALAPYHRRLFLFLSVASFFEGFDYYALAQLLPELRTAFSLTVPEGTSLASFINIGMVLSFFLVRQGDRLGRHRLLAWTITGYMVFTALSALSQNVGQFAVCQMLARLFQSAEVATVMVFAAEEFPADRRGFVLGVIQGTSSLGAIVCAGVTPLLTATTLGWRMVYLVGGVPLLLVAYLRRNLRDTARFAATETQTALPLARVFQSRYLPRLLLLSLIWALVMFCTQSALLFWKDFAVTERHFSAAQVAQCMTIAAVGSLPLVFSVGKLLDVVGRKASAVVVFGLTILGVLLSYTRSSQMLLTLGVLLGIAGTTCMLSVVQTLTTELFPTEIRAESFGVANNLIGRTAGVLSPLLIGFLAVRFGYGPAVQSTAIGPLFAMLLILLAVAETRGKELEETAALPD
ncbi:MAG TPA: MFS transporter [Pseudomonadota bacterium]|nr:MFS transporter [Pseudomonadota bacterium]HNK43988.1 MFS transporter [Pseudomonadota bacterium]HNN50351.1 MFS transporter [Pseudomonadota bacterium]